MDFTGIGSIAELGSKLIDRLWQDPAQKDAAKLELFKLQQAGEFKDADRAFELANAQINVNIEEAKSSNLFVSGWRPFIGWVCGLGLFYQFIVYPILISFVPKIAQLDMGTLLTLLMGLLGLSGMRTFEKMKGVTK